jgi:hypothetical protein
MGDQLITETITYITHKKHNRLTYMPSEGFKPMIPATEQNPSPLKDSKP